MVEKKCWPDAAAAAVKKFRSDLPKPERSISIRQRRDIIQRGRRSRYQTILMAAQPQSRWRMGIYLQQIKGAFRRNQIKRKIREAYRTAKPFFMHPYAMVFTVIGDPGPVSVHDFRAHLIKTYDANDATH